MKYCAGEPQSLLLAATHRARHLFALLGEVVPDQQILDTVLPVSLGVGVDLGNELQVFQHGHIAEQGEFLRHVANLGAQVARPARNLGAKNGSPSLR